MTNLYIDIDGVLVDRVGRAADGVVAFLRFVTEHFDCYWLTTHCDGDVDQPFLYLVGKLPAEALPYLEKIRPTKFGALKTEGIDFSTPFYWLDDTVFESEQAVLRSHGVEWSFLYTDLSRGPSVLRHALSYLQKRFPNS